MERFGDAFLMFSCSFLFFFFFFPLGKLNNRFNFSIVFLRLTKPSRCFSSLQFMQFMSSYPRCQAHMIYADQNLAKWSEHHASSALTWCFTRKQNKQLVIMNIYHSIYNRQWVNLIMLTFLLWAWNSIGLKKKTSKHQITTDTIILYNHKSERQSSLSRMRKESNCRVAAVCVQECVGCHLTIILHNHKSKRRSSLSRMGKESNRRVAAVCVHVCVKIYAMTV